MTTLLNTSPMQPNRTYSAKLHEGSAFFRFLVAESLVLSFVTMPLRLSFDSHLFRDPAELLATQYLVTHGYRVNIDFGYHYGLLWLLIQRAWYAPFGATPLSIQPLAVFLDAIAAGALAKIAVNLRANYTGKLLLIAALPFAALSPHGLPRIEAALLLLALEQQSRGSYANALAFATACATARPTLSYLYGLILISTASFRIYRRGEFGASALAHLLFPSACTALILISLFVFMFGPWSAVTSLLPMRGATAYRIMNFGFFTGEGRFFWYFPGVRIGYYFGTVAAFWLLGTLWLVWSGFAALLLLRETTDLDSIRARAFEFVLTCALLHILFISLLYGSAASWSHFAYILVAGLAATSACFANSRTALSLLTMLAIVGSSGLMRESFNGWIHTSPGPDTHGLWASSSERSEWQSVQKFVSGHRATFLGTISGGELLAPWLEPPTCLFLTPGLPERAEVLRKIDQIEGSEFVIVPTASDSSLRQILAWNPAMRTTVENLLVVRSGAYFQVYGHINRSKN